MVHSCVFSSPIGNLKICEEQGCITGVSLVDKESSDKYDFAGVLYDACIQLDEYFSGKRKVFDLPIRYEGTCFQQKVWKQLQTIPYGETRSYSDIADAVGNAKAVRAVGQANNKNPILIIIPCHRVINKNGNLAGFACGLEVKKYLLELESASSLLNN